MQVEDAAWCVRERYLSPRAGVPLQTVLAGARVTRGHFWGAFSFTAVQREVGHVVCQAYGRAGSSPLPALSRALVHTRTHTALNRSPPVHSVHT